MRSPVTGAGACALLVGVATAALALAACAGPSGEGKDVMLATTTSTYDSGLLDVLIPEFEARTGYNVKPSAVGTGKALAMGERGEADVLLVHAPAGEEELVASGAAVSREVVMHNYFALVGPPSDPADIRGLSTAAAAMARIADGEALFMSRGDDSGTHRMEMALWAESGVAPGGRWYQESGQGMGATLAIASERSGYTLADRGTFLALRGVLRLEALVDQDRSLLNTYSVLELNGERFPKVNVRGGAAFAEFLLSAEAQVVIEAFGVAKYGEPLFVPGPGG